MPLYAAYNQTMAADYESLSVGTTFKSSSQFVSVASFRPRLALYKM